MMSLLREFAAKGDTQADLKSSDGSDAGKSDTRTKPVDVGFSMMRNIINKDGPITGSDVNDYLERARDLNDEVETVCFGIDTNDGPIPIKIYVAAEQAAAFEEEMAKMLGLDDDAEAAINTLAQKFDIIDVVWPQDPDADGNAEDPYADVSIDDDVSNFMDPASANQEPETTPAGEENPDSSLPADALPADEIEAHNTEAGDEEDEEGEGKSSLLKSVAADADSEEDSEDVAAPTDSEGNDEPSNDKAMDDEDTGDEPPTDDTEATDDTEDSLDAPAEDEAEEPELDDKGQPKLDADGNPVMKKKAKPKTEKEEGTIKTEEGLTRLGRLAEAKLHNNGNNFFTWCLSNNIADEEDLYDLIDTAYNDDTDIDSLAQHIRRNICKKKKRPEEMKDRVIAEIAFLASWAVQGEGKIAKKLKAAAMKFAVATYPKLVKDWGNYLAVLEDVRDDINSHVKEVEERGNKGKYYIMCRVQGGVTGLRVNPLKNDAGIMYFDTEDEARAEAGRLNKKMNHAYAKADYSYTVKLEEAADKAHSLDSIRAALKPMMKRFSAVESQQDYDALLKSFGEDGDVVDKHVNPKSIDASADKLHYHQKLDPQVASFLKKHLKLKEDNMTLGSKFLSRVTEAKAADTDGMNDGFNIKLDTQLKGLANRLKKPLEKQIIALFSLVGVPGRYINNIDGIEDGIELAADMLRRKGAVRKAFTTFYTALASSKGLKIQEVDEKKHGAHKQKRGGFLQKMLEGVLVELGLPAQIVVAGGPGAVNTFLYRVSRDIDSNAELERALRQLATRLGVHAQDEVADDHGMVAESTVGRSFLTRVVGEQAELSEAEVNVANDTFFESIMALAQALGIPEKNLQFQRSVMLSNMRKVKQSLANRAMIQQRLDQLVAIVAKNTKQPRTAQQTQPAQGRQVAEALLMESFGALEALTTSDLEHYNLEEPNAGPAMLASYEGGGSHEETILAIGVDPDAEDESKNLRVAIEGPFDGTLHRKYFPNSKDGYKAALDYANILRSANLKSGGRPKGWK